MNPGDLIAAYLKIRDKKKEIEGRHTEELKPYNDTLYKIETRLGKIMDETGLTNLPGGGGTAYRSIRTSVTVGDWDSLLRWVKETENWHVLERRANKTAVDEILNDTNELPPGVNVNRSVAVNVRKTN